MKESVNSLRSWLKENDVMIFDRGFRDCLRLSEDLKLVAKMPHFLRGEKQHTDTEANESRLITNVRWVVESVNALLKTCNAYRPPRIHMNENEQIVAQRMLRSLRIPNTLQIRIEKENWARKRIVWQDLDAASMEDIPKLTYDELHDITLGIYQLKQAKSYTQEHKKSEHGLYIIQLHKDTSNIIRVKIQSRHKTSKNYTIWIEYNISTVLAWYCQCKVGARTVGCCAHIASVISNAAITDWSDGD